MNEARCIAYRDDGAICGELAPTEAELARREGRPDEPASASLERFEAQREAAHTTTSRRRRSRECQPATPSMEVLVNG